MGSIDICLKFERSPRVPDFGSGMTLAIFSEQGNWPSAIDRIIKNTSTGRIIGSTDFRVIGWGHPSQHCLILLKKQSSLFLQNRRVLISFQNLDLLGLQKLILLSATRCSLPLHSEQFHQSLRNDKQTNHILCQDPRTISPPIFRLYCCGAWLPLITSLIIFQVALGFDAFFLNSSP